MKTCDAPSVKVDIAPTVKDVCIFLSEYSSWLLGCGATCIRIEKNLQRMAAAYGKTVCIQIMPRHINLSVREADGSDFVTSNIEIKAIPISFNINTRLSELSWNIADEGLPLDVAWQRFRLIVDDDRQNKWLVLLLVSVANASFCRLFGGDAVAMTTVGLATLAGYWVKTVMIEKGVDIRLIFIVCALISSVLGATDYLFAIGNAPEIAIGTSVLYLVPGIPLLNSFSDMLNRHYICALSRFCDAMILTGCLSVGLCAGMALMHTGMF